MTTIDLGLMPHPAPPRVTRLDRLWGHVGTAVTLVAVLVPVAAGLLLLLGWAVG